ERLHPGEYAARLPQAAAAFDVLRNDRPFETFNGRVETALVRKDAAVVLEILDARPGELARRLDHLARAATDPAAVVARVRARAGGGGGRRPGCPWGGGPLRPAGWGPGAGGLSPGGGAGRGCPPPPARPRPSRRGSRSNSRRPVSRRFWPASRSSRRSGPATS